MGEGRGITLALLTAVVSGFSVFLNKFAVSGLDASAFSFAKNLMVAALLCALIFAFRDFKTLRLLPRKSWLSLAAIGLIGGSIPFLLFFNALKFASAQNAAFLHKTLFIWVAIFAVVFLRERLSRRVLAGAALLMAAVVVMFGIDFSAFGMPEVMILAAAVMWAAESVYAKHVMQAQGLAPRTVAFGRMAFGAVFMIPFIFATGSAAKMFALTPENLFWIALSSVLLLTYVSLWYPALRHARASVAASVLMVALPITAALDAVFAGKAIAPSDAIGFVLIVAGVLTMVGIGYFYASLRGRISLSKSGAARWQS